jgi:hypothetical protein
VAVELVPGAQIDAAVNLPAHLMKADTVDLMLQGSAQIGYSDLDLPGSQHSAERHRYLRLSPIVLNGASRPDLQ